MAYTNLKALLIDATKFPAAIEAMLPAQAPKLSTMLADAAGKIPTIPDFPMAIPDLPAPPTLPALPTLPGAGVATTTVVTSRLPLSPTNPGAQRATAEFTRMPLSPSGQGAARGTVHYAD